MIIVLCFFLWLNGYVICPLWIYKVWTCDISSRRIHTAVPNRPHLLCRLNTLCVWGESIYEWRHCWAVYMYIRFQMTFHCPMVCLRPPRGVAREEGANIVYNSLHLSANRRQTYFCLYIQRKSSNQDTLKWGHLDEEEFLFSMYSPCNSCVPWMSKLEGCLLHHFTQKNSSCIRWRYFCPTCLHLL